MQDSDAQNKSPNDIIFISLTEKIRDAPDPKFLDPDTETSDLADIDKNTEYGVSFLDSWFTLDVIILHACELQLEL